MKKIILVTLLLFIFTISIKAECNDTAYANLVFEAKALEYNYALYDTGLGEELPIMRYRVTVKNINSNLVVKYEEEDITLSASNNTFSNLAPGKSYFFSVSSSGSAVCPNINLTSKYISLPNYNAYVNTPECEESPEFKYCDKNKSVSEVVSYDDFIKSYYAYYLNKINQIEFPKQEKEPINSNSKNLDIKWIIIPSGISIFFVIITILVIRRKRKII